MTATLSAWFNGELIASPLASTSVASSADFLLDRSNTFGDGVFETMLVTGGQVHLLDRHLHRLAIGLERLGIVCSAELVQADINKALSHLSINSDSSPSTHILKFVISPGSSVFGYGSNDLSINRLVLLKPHLLRGSSTSPSNKPSNKPLSEASGLQLMVCGTRLGLQPALAGIKHCNRLEQVLAKKEVEREGFDDGLMLDQAGNVIESTSANIFILEAGQLVTPPIIDCGVAGVMREYVIDQLDIPVSEATISIARLCKSDGVILTNSVRGLMIVSACRMADGSLHHWPKSDTLMALQQAVNRSMDSQ